MDSRVKDDVSNRIENKSVQRIGGKKIGAENSGGRAFRLFMLTGESVPLHPLMG
jgi:hypothetical protein